MASGTILNLLDEFLAEDDTFLAIDDIYATTTARESQLSSMVINRQVDYVYSSDFNPRYHAITNTSQVIQAPIAKDNLLSMPMSDLSVDVMTIGASEAAATSSLLTPAQRKRLVRAKEITQTRREQNRIRGRRHYHRKLNMLNDLRTEVKQLETQVKQLTSQSSDEDNDNDAISSRRPAIENLLLQLNQTRTRLTKENEWLQRKTQQKVQDFASLRDLLYAEYELFAKIPSSFLVMKPITVQDCHQIRDAAFGEIELFRGAMRPFNLTGNVCGWEGRRTAKNGFLYFALQKAIHSSNFDAVCKYTWAMLTNPSEMQKLYSAVVKMRIHLVQKVDEENFILFQEYQSMDSGNDPAVMKTLFLVSRTKTAEGFYRTILKGLQRNRLEVEDYTEQAAVKSGRTVVWNDMLCWLEVEPGANENEIVCRNSGVSLTVGANAYYWMMEILLMTLRWETAAIGPRFSLPL